jgi:hypothetical protein
MAVQVNTSGHNDQTSCINMTKSGVMIGGAHYSTRFNPDVSCFAIDPISGIMDSSANENKWIMKY